MRIPDKAPELQLPDSIKPAPAPVDDPGNRDVTHPILPIRRADHVQISDAGRALANRSGQPVTGEHATTAISPERAAEVRRRVLDGAYNSLTVVDQVARRILSSGDI